MGPEMRRAACQRLGRICPSWPSPMACTAQVLPTLTTLVWAGDDVQRTMSYRRQEAHRDDRRGGPLLLHTAASAEPAATDWPPLRRFLLSSGPRVGARPRQLFALHLCRSCTCTCTCTPQLTELVCLCPLVVARQLRSLHAHAGPEDCLCTYERRTIPTGRV
jgi:hypothetical protein